MCKECCKFIFMVKKKNALDLMDFNRILLALKIILQARTVLIKADPFFLRKIHFKKLRKTMKKKCYRKKKKNHSKLKPSSKKLQIYIKWTTKFKTLMVSIKYMSHSRDSPHSHIMWWVQPGNLILTKLYRAPWWLVSLSNKSNRPSIWAH